MDFLLSRGRDFEEEFNFKNPKGRLIALPAGRFRLILEHGDFAREFTVENHGLSRTRTQVTWRIPAEQGADFEYSTLYYTLYLEDSELARGILRVQ